MPAVEIRFCAHSSASSWSSTVRVTTTVGCAAGTLGRAAMPTTLADQSPTHRLGLAPPLGVTPALALAEAATSAQEPPSAAWAWGAWRSAGGLRVVAAGAVGALPDAGVASAAARAGRLRGCRRLGPMMLWSLALIS